MEYKIVEHHNASTLADIINTEMGNGWRPQGGVYRGHGNDYMQALVKSNSL
jgi:hypothetical protein